MSPVQKMGLNVLVALSVVATVSSWSLPLYQQRGPPTVRYPGFALMPQTPVYRLPVPLQVAVSEDDTEEDVQRPKRDHFDPDDHGDHEDSHDGSAGVTGPVHTFVKTDRHANYKWGVRHHVGSKYSPA